MVQYFKGDTKELQFYAAGSPIVQQLSEQKTLFFDEAYTAFPLGEVLFDTGRSPLANAIPREIFRQGFYTIFQAFVEAGSFESYLTVFRNIFGPDVAVEFTVPAPGKLEIEIAASGIQIYNFITRYIVGGTTYAYDNMVDDVGDNIVFQSVQGLGSVYEIEQMLFEMVPAGIYTEITLIT